MNCSIIIPAHNEVEGLRGLLPDLRRRHPDAELIVVDDGSVDATAEVARQAGARVVSLPYCSGNGAAIKAGARAAGAERLVFMDGDGQHAAEDVERLLAGLDQGFEMVVGARDAASHAGLPRRIANRFYNLLASALTGRKIADLTSGFRAVQTAKFREFLHLLPNGFSYPTTITMSFLRAGYPVQYLPIKAAPRIGRSHISPLRDGIRFILIIFRIGTLYSPLKVFFPISAALFLLALGNYAYTYLNFHRFTNMSALLFLSSLFVFLFGLVSEQITALMYQRRN